MNTKTLPILLALPLLPLPACTPAPQTQPQPQAQSQPNPDPQPNPQPQPHSQPHSQPQPQPDPQPQPQPDSQPQPDPQPQPQPTWTPLDPKPLHFVASKDGPFHSNIAIERPGPRLAHIRWPDTPAQDAFAEEHEDGDMVLLDAAQTKALGVTKPKSVWLFGPDGPCKAKVKQAYAAAEMDGTLTLETGFFLEACTPDYAPFAYVGNKAPKAKWHRAVQTFKQVVEPKSFKHPARSPLVKLGLEDNLHEETKKKAKTYVRIVEAGPVTEFGVLHLWPHEDECLEEQISQYQSALWGKATAPVWLEVEDEYAAPQLEGALTVDGALAAVVYDDRYNMYVQTKDDDREFITADHHDEFAATWGWSEGSGGCEP